MDWGKLDWVKLLSVQSIPCCKQMPHGLSCLWCSSVSSAAVAHHSCSWKGNPAFQISCKSKQNICMQQIKNPPVLRLKQQHGVLWDCFHITSRNTISPQFPTHFQDQRAQSKPAHEQDHSSYVGTLLGHRLGHPHGFLHGRLMGNVQTGSFSLRLSNKVLEKLSFSTFTLKWLSF